jgi:hypothetical protein
MELKRDTRRLSYLLFESGVVLRSWSRAWTELPRPPRVFSICCGQRHWLVTLSAVKRIVFVAAVAALLGFVGIPTARADLCHDGAMKPGAGSRPSGRAAGPVFSNRCLRALGEGRS